MKLFLFLTSIFIAPILIHYTALLRELSRNLTALGLAQRFVSPPVVSFKSSRRRPTSDSALKIVHDLRHRGLVERAEYGNIGALPYPTDV